MARVMVVGADKVRVWSKLLKAWNSKCVLCWEEFQNIGSISIEHLRPKAMGGAKNNNRAKGFAMGNIGPSHYVCNQFRGTMSIIRTAELLERKRQAMGHKDFRRWINTDIPDRVVPPHVRRLYAYVKQDNGRLIISEVFR